jgi:prolyl-tRNA editing enzyme YbaK/EbsC (Cys-tRNA(Pro) deacylase)
MSGETRALAALQELGIEHRVTRHGPVRSLEEAAAARGIDPRDLVKTIVVRRGDDDYVFVLVPGDREFSWPKLRALLGVSRLSMPDAATAKDVTADEAIVGRTISMGGGAHGVGITVAADDAIGALGATVADVSGD